MDVERLLVDAAELDWTNMGTITHMDNKISIFNDVTIRLYNTHAPIKTVKIKRAPAPWKTEEVRAAMKRKDQTFLRYKKNRDEDR